MPHIKHLIFLVFLALATLHSLAQQERDARIQIVENHQVGYINGYGEVVIPPVYLSGADFSEGLAAVRTGGKYGFIDPHGKWVIPANYDFASSFRFGLAAVYTEGKIQLLDKTGKCVLNNPDYQHIQLISANRAIVTTTKNNYLLIAIRSDKALVKTRLMRINEFRDGVAVVLRKSKKEYGNPDYAVIDTNGRFVVPFGIYSDIRGFVDGVSLVERYADKSMKNEFDGAIDTTGKLLFSRPKTSQSYLFNDFHDGLAVIHFSYYWDQEKKEFRAAKKDYSGYINLRGEIVRNDTLDRYLNDFSDGRVFIKHADGKFGLYDRHFHRVTEEVFDQYEVPGFRNGFARVRKKSGWAIIDSNGTYYCEPKFAEITAIDYEKQVLIYEMDTEQPLYATANFRGEPIFDSIRRFDRDLFRSGLMQVIINNRLTYINPPGEIVWQEQPEDSKELIPLNTDYMISGYFRAFSEADEEDLGGYGGSMNFSKQIMDTRKFKANELSVFIDSSKPDTFSGTYKGLTLYVANNSFDTVRFSAQDSRLDMNVQAKDARGKWRDIEHLPGSWCGNSYHMLKLKPGHYWSFVTPVYAGEYQTKLRVKLVFRSGKSTGDSRTIYSNEYEGSVNPGQFWNKDHHIPESIMDPYSY